MHSAFALVSLLAASVFAAPAASNNGKSVTVILQSQSTETGSQTTFKSVNRRKEKAPVGSSGPFETIEISVGPNADQALRCQALDASGTPLVATRGTNIDTSFSDADKGPWTFQKPDAEVARIVCDPALEAISADNFQVTVILSGDDELATQTVFDNSFVRSQQPPTGSSGPYNTVELSVGAQVNPALRCAVLDKKGRSIVVLRGANRDVTFSDADKGPWTFEAGNKRVSNVICDPTFVAQSA
jgi:hypothetical protein